MIRYLLLFFVSFQVSALTINSPLPNGYEVGNLSIGAEIYIDRTYIFTDIPSKYIDQTYIKPRNNDKNHVDGFSFDVDVPVRVLVGFNIRDVDPPAWLSEWSSTGETITTNDTSFAIHEKFFPSGTIALLGNDGGGYSMYTVIVEELPNRVVTVTWDHDDVTAVDGFELHQRVNIQGSAPVIVAKTAELNVVKFIEYGDFCFHVKSYKDVDGIILSSDPSNEVCTVIESGMSPITIGVNPSHPPNGYTTITY